MGRSFLSDQGASFLHSHLLSLLANPFFLVLFIQFFDSTPLTYGSSAFQLASTWVGALNCLLRASVFFKPWLVSTPTTPYCLASSSSSSFLVRARRIPARAEALATSQ